MQISRRNFLRASAITAAATAAGVKLDPSLAVAANSVKTFPVGQCRYCAVGCTIVADAQVDAAGKAKKIIAIKGDMQSTVNRGVLCTKGFYLHRAMDYQGRPKGALVRKEWINPATGKPDLANSPRVRDGVTTKDPRGITPSDVDLKENFALVPWEDAIEFVADAVEKTVRENGKHSVAYYGSGQLGSEETHIMNKAFKGGGMLANNAIEGQPRTCMASAVVGYLYTFGKDEPYGSYDDLDVPDPDFNKHADTFFLIGSNTAEAHPIPFNRIAAVKQKNPDQVKVILADPRKTRSGTIADLWLPFATGRDLALLNSMAYVIAREMDNAEYDVEKGTVSADWNYLDRKFIERHANFGIHEDVKKTWIKTEYGGIRGTAHDMSHTMGLKRAVYPDLKKKYGSEREIMADLYKGFAMFLEFLSDYNPDQIADIIFEGESPLLYDRDTRTWKKISGPEAIRLAAEWFAKGYTTSVWCMGVNQKVQGTWTNASLHMLNLITGKAVKPGRHSFSFTGQPNACGGIRAPGALCHALPYGRVVANPIHRGQVENLWKERAAAYLKKQGVSESEIKAETDRIQIHPIPGPHTQEMFRRLASGQIKVQFVACVNPGQSLAYSWPYRKAMGAAAKGSSWPITVTLESFPTATTTISDVVLGASSWYEKEFIFGNLERRYQVIKQVVEPAGDTVPDHTIFACLVRRLEEKGLVPKGHVSQFWPEEYDGADWLKKTISAAKTPEWNRQFSSNIWEEMQALSGGTGYNFTGMNRDVLLDRNHGYRIPFPADVHTDPAMKARYDKYESRIQYAYPYDPLVERITNAYLGNQKAINPAYGRWLEKNINAMKADREYQRANNVPEGWFASFYNSNAFIHGFLDHPDGHRVPGFDGRAIIWANPWWACKFDGKKFAKYQTVDVVERKFNAAKVDESSVAPFDVTSRYTVKVVGDPDREVTALKSIVFSPADIQNHKEEFIKDDGSRLVMYDTTGYVYGACTGRVVEHWHTGSMTTRVAELSRAVPKAYVELNAELATKLNIREGDPVIVESRRGKVELPAKVLDVTRATGGPRHDYVFIPWFDEFKLVNMIMNEHFDPLSFQMDYKMFSVKLSKGTIREQTQAVPGPIIA
ncbi:molybdopterin oxidoreductase family protein [Desulfurivibrio alkaliphilus]|uniref:Nitrate reductase n=1 Tax=Desulfurivibrio alkaliphilus (strain DSM 19089 / UNIQEM U267 / AHT2) TaxID=589865 RepID=D6Z4W2_DESAT|nr:molybdopterin oxidoreductase family protein [Desulfurivibrio alkaliphilus]ADH86587.1 Nitrate reductase [Desulfurivibrio alkaliphilus AHT 2]